MSRKVRPSNENYQPTIMEMEMEMKMKREVKRRTKRKLNKIYGTIERWRMKRILDKLLEKRIEVSKYVLFYISNMELLYIYENAERIFPELKENDKYAVVYAFNLLNKHVDYVIYDS